MSTHPCHLLKQSPVFTEAPSPPQGLQRQQPTSPISRMGLTGHRSASPRPCTPSSRDWCGWLSQQSCSQFGSGVAREPRGDLSGKILLALKRETGVGSWRAVWEHGRSKSAWRRGLPKRTAQQSQRQGAMQRSSLWWGWPGICAPANGARLVEASPGQRFCHFKVTQNATSSRKPPLIAIPSPLNKLELSYSQTFRAQCPWPFNIRSLPVSCYCY